MTIDRHLILINIITALIYVVLFAIQDWGFQQHSEVASLIFLPHGWRIVSFFLFKFKALPGLYVGHVLTCMIFFNDFNTYWLMYMVTSIPGTFALPAVYCLLKAIGYDLLATRPEYPVVPWSSYLLMGAIATAFNGLLVQLVFSLGRSAAYQWDIVFSYMIGDMIGFVTFTGSLLLYFRWQRRRHYIRSSSTLPTE